MNIKNRQGMVAIMYVIVALVILGAAGFAVVKFTKETPPQEPISEGRCVLAGCSGQVCAEESEAGNIVTTCEYRPEYACYRDARCERQPNGRCGWTETPGLRACLSSSVSIQ